MTVAVNLIITENVNIIFYSITQCWFITTWTTQQHHTYRFNASKDLTWYSGDFGSFRRTSMSVWTLTNWLWSRLFMRDTSAFDGSATTHWKKNCGTAITTADYKSKLLKHNYRHILHNQLRSVLFKLLFSWQYLVSLRCKIVLLSRITRILISCIF